MNRGKRVIKNTMWEMGYYFATILLGFLAPRYIIFYYGSEVNGLFSTITQILNIVLLLQAGATTAAIYSLYRPIAENDLENICKNVAYAETFFKRISYIFFVLMVIVAVTVPFFINTKIERNLMIIAFLVMGMKCFVDLYFTAKFRIVFTAYQEKFYISIATLIEQIIYYTLVFTTIFMRGSFLLIYLSLLIGCMVKVGLLIRVFKKKHPYIDTKQYKNSGGHIYHRGYALANEVSHSVVNSSTTVIMSILYGLEETSVYSVYILVSQALNLIGTAIYSSFAPSFGDMIAGKNKASSSKVFLLFQYIYTMFNTILMMCVLFLIIPFIKIYISESSDINYINISLANMLALCGLFSAYRIPYNVLVSSCGYFKETWLQPVVTAVVCVMISFFLGMNDYTWIITGTIIFYIANFVYQHFRLKKMVSWLICNNIFIYLLISLGGLILTICLSIVVNFPEGIFNWIVYGIGYIALCIGYIVVMSAFFAKEELQESIKYIKRLIGGM